MTTIQSGNLVTFTIKVNGDSLPDEISVFAIRVESAMSVKPKASIEISSSATQDEAVLASTSALFAPGAKVTIEVGYDSHNQLIFDGVISGQAVDFITTTSPLFTAECEDNTASLTNPKSASSVLTLQYGNNILELNTNYAPSTSSQSVHGSVTCQGTAVLEPGKYITLSGIGENFNGDHLVSGVKQTLSSGSWITKATLGLTAG